MSGTIIIDANNLAHRCKHVFSLSNAGEDVSVLYGFLYVLISYMRRFQPLSVVVAWDGGIPSYRTTLLPNYKANRHLNDDPIDWQIFKSQLNKLQTILPSFGVISIMNYGSEADDLMYHASRIIETDSVIISGDRDMLQAVNDKTSIFAPSSKDGGTLVTRQEIEKHIPVKLSSYLDWRALQGDSSDNIIGVHMVGEKTATKLFEQYGSLSAIVAAATSGGLPGRVGENIAAFGVQKLLDNIAVMSLWKDRTGAKQAIVDAANIWTPFSKNIVKRFFMTNAFTSFLDPEIYTLFGTLKNISIKSNIRIPVCKERRKPLG